MIKVWRVGRSVGRTIYCDDVLAGVLDDPAIAALVVEELNHRANGGRPTCPHFYGHTSNFCALPPGHEGEHRFAILESALGEPG